MPTVTFLPSNKIAEVPPGTLVSEAAASAGVPVCLPCGGKGVCGRCLVEVRPAAPDLTGDAGNPVRACATRVNDVPLLVTVSDKAPPLTRFADSPFPPTSEFMVDGRLSPMVESILVDVPPPRKGDGLSDFDRLHRAVKTARGGDLELSLDHLTRLPRVLRDRDGLISLRFFPQGQRLRAVSITSDKRRDYGLAIDIGTTTVAVCLVSLDDGEILASEATHNSQIDRGSDIISRIHYARDESHLVELRDMIRGTLAVLVGNMASQLGLDPDDIVSASIAGNTTMIHLLLGIPPEFIRLHPYTPAVFRVPVFTAGSLGLPINRHSPVYVSAAVGSYVGGDVVSGLLLTPLSGQPDLDAPMMFIDIGTNGEIVLGGEDYLLGCACSAGPAFEGGGIADGCRASRGAIERVKIDKETGACACATIDDAPPTGICGSGVISLVAELFRLGFIDAAGRFSGNAPLVEVGGRQCFQVANHISISERDIDNLIRAKAAVFSACATLLDSVGLSFCDLQRLYVAGGFGSYLDVDDAATIGLLPRLEPRNGEKRISFLGNASLSGAYMSLVSAYHRKRGASLAKRITYIDLSDFPGYQDAYTAALFLPHTTIDFA